MKRIILSIVLAFGASISYAQQAYPCHTDEKEQELLQTLSEVERNAYLQQKELYLIELNQYITDNPELLVNDPSRGTVSYTIPIVFHILHAGGPENIPDQQVYDAVDQMNLDFQMMNSDLSQTVSAFQHLIADAQIEFKLAKKDPQGNCTNGITRTFTQQTFSGDGNAQVNAVKAQHGNWAGDKYLNIFVCSNIGGAAGYTMYPSEWLGNSMGNGIFVLDTYCGRSYQASSTSKHTLTHEAGHWLNLPHLWGNSNEPGLQSNCNIDDGVADTPLTKGWTSCNLSGTSCDGTLDNVQNYMEYSYCSTMFTLGQKARMHAALNNSTGGRNNLWKTANLNFTGVNNPDVLCSADFSVNKTDVCSGSSVSFTDHSYHNVTSWQWTFEGGNPATSNEQNPTVFYETPGDYQVKLVVSDGTGTETKTVNNLIKVKPYAVELPFHEGFENISNINNSSFWSVENSSSNSAAFAVSSEASYTGNKSIRLKNFGQAKNNEDALVSSAVDLSEVTSTDKVTLSFRYAYRRRTSSNNEKLKVLISSNCGDSWIIRKTLQTSQLGIETASSSWKPTSQEDWVTFHMTNVTSTYWTSNFMFKFVFESDGGNNLFIDDINIYEGLPSDEIVKGDGSNPVDPPGGDNNDTTSEIESFEQLKLLDLNIYPNPAEDYAYIEFNIEQNHDVKVEMLDMLGQEIQAHVIHAISGRNIVDLNLMGVRSGMYLIRLTVGDTQQVKRMVIQ